MNQDNINLDKALHDLGMLSAITEARREYLRESKSDLNVMRLDSRYVSNVTVGYCMKRVVRAKKSLFCPYVVPERHRTKSENSDAVGDAGESTGEVNTSIYEPSTSNCNKELFEIKSPAKRCQSLENLNLAVEPTPDADISPELDCMSNRIKKLQVDD